eukprot:TRINITY_DN55185_c0_g1_i1.p1 TRINITY_DN55185_c0_g1~~TRINITY_DN55185_c0_g1_i1.p1  ORF type:complete len:905 (-),score=105.46 TRINITY_DN55185_c0_g1_i1:69-2783(-)
MKGKGYPGKGKGPRPPVPASSGSADSRAKLDWRAKLKQAEETKKNQVGVDVSNLPAGVLDDPQWNTAFAAVASSEGSDGVVFIATNAGGYVVKASSKPAEEYFATKVLRQLGVRSPDIRIVCHVDNEWREIKQALKISIDRARARGDSSAADILQHRLNGSLNRAQLSVMSLVPHAAPLLGNTRAQAFFEGRADSAAVADELSILGRCLAVDVLLNNCDRFMASCWDNDGNGDNVLLASCSAGSNATLQVVAIDSACTCFSTSTIQFENYARSARQFLDSVCDEASAVVALDPLRTFMFNNCGVTLEDVALLEVRKGVLQVVSNIAAAKGDEFATSASDGTFIEWLEALKASVQNDLVRIDWANVWQSSASLIDMNFLRHMVSIFQEVAMLRKECLPKCIPAEHSRNIGGTPASSNPELSDELWNALPSEIQHELTNVQNKPFKILVLQIATTTSSDCAREVNDALNADRERSGKMAGLVLLAEIQGKLLSDITPILADKNGNPPIGGCTVPFELKELAEVAKDFGVYIVCGTMHEPEEEGKPSFYITSVVVGRDGRAIGAYRMRKIHNEQVQLRGDRPLVFNVHGLGKVAVLICQDAEDPGLQKEVLDLGVRCVLNPISIPGMFETDAEAGQRAWQSAIDHIADRFTYICYSSGITVVRCDRPYPNGLGSSQIVGPEFTYRTCDMNQQVLSVCILPPASSSGHVPLLMKVPAVSYCGDELKQNCGSRCTISSAFVDGRVTSMHFYRSPKHPQAVDCRRIHVTLSDQSVAAMHVSPSLCIEKMGKLGTLAFIEILAEAATADLREENDSVIAEHNNGRWLDNDKRFLLSLNGACQLTLSKMGGDGQLRRPLVIPTSERFQGLAVDKQSGIFATVSWIDDGKSRVSVWCFSHNGIPAPLPSFLEL